MKVLLFFCDIEGTLTGNNDTLNYEVLFSKINEMKKLYKCDECIFSLLSMNRFLDVLKWFNKIKKNSDIKFGRQFYDEGYFEVIDGDVFLNEKVKDKTKLGYMKNYIEELNAKYEIKMLCYADDHLFDLYKDYFKRILNNETGVKLIQPSSNSDIYENDIVKTDNVGFNGLLDGLDKIIEKKKTKRKRAT